MLNPIIRRVTEIKLNNPAAFDLVHIFSLVFGQGLVCDRGSNKPFTRNSALMSDRNADEGSHRRAQAEVSDRLLCLLATCFRGGCGVKGQRAKGSWGAFVKLLLIVGSFDSVCG